MANKKIREVIFSFDYELFLGSKSGNVSKCAIEPTNRILHIFSKHNIKGVFFVDTTWLVRLKEVSGKYEKAKEDFNKVAGQIQEMAKSGHYIFPHIHPHWLDARYLDEINQWELNNYSKYRFHSISTEQRNLIFKKSVGILNDIILPVQPDFIPFGYRAGGWSIEPFEDFEPYFKQYGVKYDFSVLSNQKMVSSSLAFDFSKIKQACPYKFSSGVAIPSDIGEYVEFPISNIKMPATITFLNRIFAKYLWIMKDRGYGDGIGVQVTEDMPRQNTDCEMTAIELLTRIKLPVYVNFLKENSYMQFICHPKMLSNHNFEVLEAFISIIFDKYDVETDFLKMLPNFNNGLQSEN